MTDTPFANNKKFILFLSCSIALLLLSSCVSTTKYAALENSKNELQTELVRLQVENYQYKESDAVIGKLKDELQTQTNEFQDLKQKYDNLNLAHLKIEKDYKDLLTTNTNLLENSSSENQKLSIKLAEKEIALNQQEKKLTELEKELLIREKRIKDLEAEILEQKEQVSSLFSQISNVLNSYSSEELSVERKEGKIYISLSQNLLFATGSDKLDQKGIQAIEKVGQILSNEKDFYIEVEGHTDTDGSAQRNWELSTDRAVSVVKVLQDTGVDPKRLIASGRAFYIPVAPNDTEVNKAKNRRTEIILSPDLKKLYTILNEKQ